jgi:hypothetical protein
MLSRLAAFHGGLCTPPAVTIFGSDCLSSSCTTTGAASLFASDHVLICRRHFANVEQVVL